MDKSIDAFVDRIRGIRGAQVTPNLVGSVKVMHLGQQVPICHVANPVRTNSQNITVTVYDPFVLKDDAGLLPRIAKSLEAAGFNAYVFSKESVSVSVEQYGQRAEVERLLRTAAEEARVAVRNVRKKLRQKLSKMSKDEKREAESEIQIATDRAIAEIDDIVDRKLKAL